MNSITQERKEAQLTVAVLMARFTALSPYQISQAVTKLGSIAQTLHTRYEALCSYEWANTEAYEKRTATMEKKAETIGKECGVVITHQRDPRGWPLIVSINGHETRLG